MLTSQQQRWKHLALLLGIIYFVTGYCLSARFAAGRPAIIPPTLAWEQAIPFWPPAIWGYLLPYPTILLTHVFIKNFALYRRFVLQFFIVTALHFLCFILIPMHINRPAIIDAPTLALRLTQWYYMIDLPNNLFPSLHVSLPLLCGVTLWSYRRRWSVIVLGLTAIIAASVLLVKQHYVIDVLGSLMIIGGVCLVHRTKTTCPIA